ncbi:MAG: cyclic pyranopterin monophosphate synthase MoaC [Candidatus Bipolaricaulia bacterium]
MSIPHLDERGRARMVDVSEKPVTERVAIAKGSIMMSTETLRQISDKKIKKGDVLTVAQVGGIMGAKWCSTLIPLCHPLEIDDVAIEFDLEERDGRGKVTVLAEVKSSGKTGVEMEALTACTIALLTIYDMCKSLERGMEIGEIYLVEKRGGESGTWRREEGVNGAA